MTEIKICGITRLEDALCAAECGADAVGFIFHSASPRYISAETAMAIVVRTFNRTYPGRASEEWRGPRLPAGC